jgi:hypothetical protein
VLRPIYERGKPAMADHVGSYIRSAYSWGLKSELNYRRTSPRRFKLVSNPAADIPTEPKVAGTRWLDEDELVQLYRWLECPDLRRWRDRRRGRLLYQPTRRAADPHRASRGRRRSLRQIGRLPGARLVQRQPARSSGAAELRAPCRAFLRARRSLGISAFDDLQRVTPRRTMPRAVRPRDRGWPAGSRSRVGSARPSPRRWSIPARSRQV